jgi:hypothetical protein
MLGNAVRAKIGSLAQEDLVITSAVDKLFSGY